MELYQTLLYTEFALAVITFISLFFVSAPYGRFIRGGWGLTLKAKYGWFIMELPAVFMMGYFFLTTSAITPVLAVLILIWQSHYIYRTFFYPFFQSGANKDFPLLLVVLAIVFNLINGYVNGFEVFRIKNYDIHWLGSIQFIAGFMLFVSGFYINKQSEFLLKRLRKPGETDYKIPRGGLFSYISCPHYFGEIVQWMGWAVLTNSVAGWAFVAYTFANLAPRAISHHKWYRQQFSEYPTTRKAIIPFIW
jgi:protein-S-isoprenylcysteine O-methyltransferase Ste14